MKVRAATGSREGGVALSVDLLIRPYICLVIAIVTIAINIVTIAIIIATFSAITIKTK